MARDQDGVEVKSMISLVLVKKDLLRYVLDVKAVRGMERGLSDHHVVLLRVRLLEHGLGGERWWMELRRFEVRN